MAAIQPAAWARQLAPDDYSIKVHLELTMLLALGLADKKPAWMDEQPVLRPDGTAWSRYWWPRPMEGRELLPAARLPQNILARILPPEPPNGELGDLADALYERANQYADEECVERARRTAISRQSSAADSYHNAIQRAKWKARIEEENRKISEAARANFFPPQPPFAPAGQQMPGPQFPGTQMPPAHGHMVGPPMPFGIGHSPSPPPAHGSMFGPPNSHRFPSPPFPSPSPTGFLEPMRPDQAQADAHFAITHGIFMHEDSGSLFQSMGIPQQLVFQKLTIHSITPPAGDEPCSTTALPE